MNKEQYAYKLSLDLVSVVRRQHLTYRYGIKDCTDIMLISDPHDLYLTKILVESNYECDDVIKTEENATNKILS